MKKVALIGASGFVGTVILNELMRGHEVAATVIYRKTSVLPRSFLFVRWNQTMDVRFTKSIISGIYPKAMLTTVSAAP